MIREELRELYRTCVYCELDDDVEKELSDYELSEIFIPIIDEMISEGYVKEQLEGFIILCFSYYFMSNKTYHALRERYDLDLWLWDFVLSGKYDELEKTWGNNWYFLKVKTLNK